MIALVQAVVQVKIKSSVINLPHGKLNLPHGRVSVCLSYLSTAAAACGGFAAESPKGGRYKLTAAAAGWRVPSPLQRNKSTCDVFTSM